MILINLDQIPEGLAFAEVTQSEMELGKQYLPILEARSKDIWLISSDDGEPLFVCGVVQETILGEAFFWFMMCDAFPRKLLQNIRGIKLLMAELTRRYPFVITAVEVGCEQAERFAYLFRWKPSGPPYDWMGRTYRKYRIGG